MMRGGLVGDASRLALLALLILNSCQSTTENEEDKAECAAGCQRDHLQELPFMISPKDFFLKFVFRHRPLLMRNSSVVWPALKVSVL